MLLGFFNIFTFKSTSLFLFWQRNYPTLDPGNSISNPQTKTIFKSASFLDIGGFCNNSSKTTLKGYLLSFTYSSLLFCLNAVLFQSWKLLFLRKRGLLSWLANQPVSTTTCSNLSSVEKTDVFTIDPQL